MVDTVVLVVPVYNEYHRWNDEYWRTLAAYDGVSFVFVNDGSTDETYRLLRRAADDLGARVLHLNQNVGKAEAVRLGLLDALATNAHTVGFLDADAAVPASEVGRLIEKSQATAGADPLTRPSIWSTRVKLAGRDIQRKPLRHYGSRVLLTLLALRLDYSIYDTQSGFKLFPSSSILSMCLREPFRTRWFVDLEIFLRWRRIAGSEMVVWEEPLNGWRDIDGSSIRRGQMTSIARDLISLLRSPARGVPG